MDNRVKIGVAGAGNMGANHIRIVSELNNLFDFKGIYDPNNNTSVLAEKFGVRFYPSYELMLEDIDAIIIASPTSLHFEMALKAAKHKVHALVEKPMAETVGDVQHLQQVFEDQNLKLAVSCVERYSPVIQVLSEILKQEEILAVEVHRCSPYDPRIYDADVVSDLMIHDIDIVCNAVFNKDPLKVEAFGRNAFSEKYVDYAHAVLTFDNDVRAFITSSRCTQDKIRMLSIHAKDAFIEADMLNKTISVKRGIKYIDNIPKASYRQYNLMEQIVVPNKEPLKEDILSFGMAVSGDEAFIVEKEQIIRDMKVIDQIHNIVYKDFKLYEM